MPANKGLVIFLVRNNYISTENIPAALKAFIEYHRQARTITLNDYSEISKIKDNPRRLRKTKILLKLEPFLMPYYEK